MHSRLLLASCFLMAPDASAKGGGGGRTPAKPQATDAASGAANGEGDKAKSAEQLNGAGETAGEAQARINMEAEARARADLRIKEEQKQKDDAAAKAQAEIEAEARAEAEKNMRSAAEVAPKATLVIPQGQLQSVWKVPEATGTMVQVNVPKAFNLTFSHGKTLRFQPGIQPVDECVLNHWYAKANGVVAADQS